MAHIMMIEDNNELALMLDQAFNMTGYHVTYGRTGQEALRLLQQLETRPDVIVCDLLMPDINGADLMRHIRSNADWADIPFIFMSAAVSHNTQQDLIEQGAFAFLSKPFAMADLFTLVARCLNENQSSWARPSLF